MLLSCSIMAQEWSKNLPANATFEQQKAAFYSYYKDVPASWTDDEYSHFKRYEAFMERRSNVPNGVNPGGELWKAFKQLYAQQKSSQVSAANWNILGPTLLGNLHGLGRINCIYYDPTNSNTVWIGAASGGLWKSINGGSNWTYMSGGMPNLGISGIAIDASNTNVIYVATGDYYGGDTYSIGILKSTDGGITWNPTGLSYLTSQYKTFRRLLIDPVNPNLLFACGIDGIWRSQNAGVNWTLVKNGMVYDMEFNAVNSNTIYAASDSIYFSTNAGLTWKSFVNSPKFSGPTTPVSIDVTPADPNYIYVFDGSSVLRRSTDAGTTWNVMSTTPISTYGTWGTVLGVSRTNANEVMVGGLSMGRSVDGGATWPFIYASSSIIHADCKDIRFVPGSSTSAYFANDGGLYKTVNSGTTITNVSSGLQCTQYYRFGCAANSKTVLYGGTQDNGTNRFWANSWSKVYSGDGTEVVVDPQDSSIIYWTTQGYQLSKSTDAGTTFTFIVSDTGSFYMPYVMHPSNNQILFKGGKMVKKSTDGGWTWFPISPAIGPMNSLAVSISNPNYIYAAHYTKIYRTTTGGGTWTDVTNGLPGNITYIAISPTNPNHVWVSISSYIAANKVFETTNGGASWTNISNGLPNAPANTIVHNNNSTNDEIYIGTDLGVYYKDNGMSAWLPYNTGLPPVVVEELEIHYLTGKLRAATYGRGIWETPLNTVATNLKPNHSVNTGLLVYPNPATDQIILSVDNKNEMIESVTLNDLNGKELVQLTNVGKSSIATQTSFLQAGIYFITVRTNQNVYTNKVVVSH